MLLAKCDLHIMKLRHLLPCLALFSTSVLFAQVTNDPDITPVPVVEAESAPDSNEPLTVVEEMPEFPGGHGPMMQYVSKQLKYPEEAVENNVQGAVIVTFVVERDGHINEVKVLRGIGGGCDEEAMRVVKGMPNWSPGKQNGKLVRVRYNLPIRYAL